jgi:hypothetical protein
MFAVVAWIPESVRPVATVTVTVTVTHHGRRPMVNGRESALCNAEEVLAWSVDRGGP